MSEGFEVQAFGCRIHAVGSGAEAQALLERCVFPSLARRRQVGEPGELAVRIEAEDGALALTVDGRRIGRVERIADLAPELVRALDDAVIQRLAGMHAIHAGTVAWGEQALLLPGMSHAGKSSLVAELVRRGARYFSDEYGLIDGDGAVHPYPRPLMLRNGGPVQRPTLPQECGGRAGDRPARVAWIMALQYVPGGEWRVRRISQSEGALTLLGNTPHVWAERPELAAALTRAAAGAECFAGERGEAGEAAEAILAVTGGA